MSTRGAILIFDGLTLLQLSDRLIIIWFTKLEDALRIFEDEAK